MLFYMTMFTVAGTRTARVRMSSIREAPVKGILKTRIKVFKMPATVPPRLTGSCPLPVKIYFQAQKPMVLLPSLSPSMSFPGSQTYPFCPALP